jgi:hypothetical protein
MHEEVVEKCMRGMEGGSLPLKRLEVCKDLIDCDRTDRTIENKSCRNYCIGDGEQMNAIATTHHK